MLLSCIHLSGGFIGFTTTSAPGRSPAKLVSPNEPPVKENFVTMVTLLSHVTFPTRLSRFLVVVLVLVFSSANGEQ